MSTPVGSSQWMYTSSSVFYPYLIDQSLRLDKASNANLSFTPSSAGSTNTGTISVWLKRTQVGTYQIVYQANGGTYDSVWINTNDQLQIILGSTSTAIVGWNRKFRDTGSWGHLVIKLDVSNGTANQRIIVYWNGEDIGAADLSSNTSYPASSAVFGGWFKNAVTQRINFEGGSTYGDGYVAEMHVIDGTALGPTSFGETINGIWVPKEVSGLTYGTNGFYLSFADSSAIGDDLSGNTNDWTANNLVASDVVSDSPTNNFATWNPLDLSGSIPSFFEGNLKVERSGNFAQAYSSFSFDSGKWYAEYLIDTGNADPGVIAGTTNAAANRYLGQDTFTYGYYRDGRKINSGSYTSYGGSYSVAADGSGDVVGVYIDADAGDIYFSVNGTVQNSGTAAFTGVTGPFRFAADTENGGFVAVNFGQDDTFAGLKTSGSAAASDDNGNGVFYDAIALSGYLAPCTSNLPEPAIGPNSAEQADDYFNTVLYTGDGSSSNAITGVGFQPDWTWVKQRDGTPSHALFDSVRGADNVLRTNGAEEENNSGISTATFGGLTSFDSDGFTVDDGTSTVFDATNGSGDSYVAWNWKAGGTAVSNTDGSMTSQVSAAPDAGFSICTYTGTATVSESFGHGLNQAPELVITKARNTTDDWRVHGSVLGTNKFLSLSGTGAVGTDSSNGGFPDNTDTLVNLGYESTNGTNYVAYCFHSVPGYQAIGTYVGNGNADGTFVYTGFRPAFLLIGKTAVGGGWNWQLRDSARGQFNVDDNELRANTGDAESSSSAETIDFLSNGFKPRSANGATNENSYTYIYLAFAEAPFKYANAR